MKARLLDSNQVNWARLDTLPDRTVFQTREWLEFIAECQKGRPVVAELLAGSDIAGFFSGVRIEKFGVGILGSSFPGWTTPYVGFNLVDGASPTEALEAVERLAFGELRCLHLEVSDRHFSADDGKSLGFQLRFHDSYETDLRQSEEDLFKAMTSACRRCIRKAEKSGVSVAEAHDGAFADEYYEQLKDVFQKQKLVPTYGVDRVRALVRHLLPTGRLLLLRAIGPDGACIGTGIYPGYNKVAEFWGNASPRASQILRPNEALHWYALRYWKSRGVEVFDWGGGGTYKEKYGPKKSPIPWFYKSRYKIVEKLQAYAANAVRMKHRLLGRMQTAPGSTETEDD